MPGDWNRTLAADYDRVAERYAEWFVNELDEKPFDREILDRFALATKAMGRVLDLGCGPGQIGRYLSERGVDVLGIDLSSKMIEIARRSNQGLSFEQGDMRALDLPDASIGGVVGFYSLIHLERTDVPAALEEIARVLVPDGSALIAVHGGEGAFHADDYFGEPVSIDVTYFETEELLGLLENVGFRVEELQSRDPYESEYPSRRIYCWARKRHDDTCPLCKGFCPRCGGNVSAPSGSLGWILCSSCHETFPHLDCPDREPSSS
jgi:SAM-dependent methyltransferase